MSGQRIGYQSDKSKGQDGTVMGSDGRFNTSSRSDSRSYYNSRDESETFSLVWADASTATSDYVLYWQNTDTTGRELVIDAVGLNSQYAADFQLQLVTGTGGGGSTATPFCLNQAKPKVAQANCFTAVSSAVTVGAIGGIVDDVTVSARGHEEFRLKDRLRLGQNQAIAIQCILTDTSPGRTRGVVYGFYE